MNNRIKELRKALGKNQQEFADSVELSRNYISLVETGDRNLAPRTIKDICRMYRVNENWLLTGDGDMFAPQSKEEEIAMMTANLFKDNSELRLRFQRVLNMATEEQLQTIYELAKMLANDEI